MKARHEEHLERVDDPTHLEEYILQRLHRDNRNFLTAITGPTGSGKSYSGLRLCERIDPDFDVDRVVFSAKELLFLVKREELPTGSAILFEEAGVEANNRKWQSTANQALNFLFQTFRSMNYMVVLTLPSLGGLDKQIRQLLHCFMPTQGIDRKRSTVAIKPLFLQTNQMTGDIYKKFLKFTDDDGQSKQLTRWHAKLPSKDLRERYEEKKREYQEDLIGDQLEELVDDMDTLAVKAGEELTDKQASVAWLCLKGLNQREVSDVLDISQPTVNEHIENILSKGWQIPHTEDDFNRYEVRRQELDEHDPDYLAMRAERVTGSDLEEADVTS